jgi:hypothetical protein
MSVRRTLLLPIALAATAVLSACGTDGNAPASASLADMDHPDAVTRRLTNRTPVSTFQLICVERECSGIDAYAREGTEIQDLVAVRNKVDLGWLRATSSDTTKRVELEASGTFAVGIITGSFEFHTGPNQVVDVELGRTIDDALPALTFDVKLR